MTVLEIRQREPFVFTAIDELREQLSNVQNTYQLELVSTTVRIQQEKVTSNSNSNQSDWMYFFVQEDKQKLNELQQQIQRLRIAFNLGKKEYYSLADLEKCIMSCSSCEQLNHLLKHLPTTNGRIDYTTSMFETWKNKLDDLLGVKRPPKPAWMKSMH